MRIDIIIVDIIIIRNNCITFGHSMSQFAMCQMDNIIVNVDSVKCRLVEVKHQNNTYLEFKLTNRSSSGEKVYSVANYHIKTNTRYKHSRYKRNKKYIYQLLFEHKLSYYHHNILKWQNYLHLKW